jgi:peptidylprolyl isomerase
MRHLALRRAGGLLLLVAGACALPARLPATIPPARGKPRVAYALRVLDLAEGRGAPAERLKCLYLDYTTSLTDGRPFYSSRDTVPNEPPRSPLIFAYGAGTVGPAIDAGSLDGMRVGGRRRLFVPYQLGYGVAGSPPVIPPRADLIFDVELMEVADTLARVDTMPPRRRPDLRPRCPAWSAVARGS